ncbi:hypothetical protein [Streptomyces xantholiticus]|uniref:Uncharacterized protein n=1 Tax=Streptomyces xantholiticus TaxID=68285 RepID=A0ABV1UNT6_9ACTN
MARQREVYYVDHVDDFGLSGLTGKVCSRSMLRLDEATVLALAGQTAAEEEDDQLGTDVQVLMNSPLLAEDIHALWLAGVRRSFDPVEEGTDMRAWLGRLADACSTRPRERDPVEVRVLDKVRPAVLEGELRETVATEIAFAAAGLEQAVAVPGIVAVLRRVVNEVDADLGFRMFLRAAKAYSLPIDADQYDRFLTIGELLAYPAAAIHEGLNVRWPAIDPGRRDFACGRFGLPMLAAVFYGSGWRYEGTIHENIERVAHADPGLVPGAQAAVLLEDVQRLLCSALSDDAVTELWRAASGRWNSTDEFDADGRAWFTQIAEVCRRRLKDVDPVYAPFVSHARVEAAEAVLQEIRKVAPDLTNRADNVGAATVRSAVRVLDELVRTVDPDLGFRLLLQILSTCEVTITEARRARYKAIGEQLGYSDDHIDDRLPALPS